MSEDQRRSRSKYLWLSSIAEHLSPPAKQIWNNLRTEFGELESPDRLWGPITVTAGKEISPAPLEELSQWSVGEIVRYCVLFVGAEESFNRPSKEGLADAITRQATERVKEFAREALEFRALGEGKPKPNPRYIHAVFRGLRNWLGQAQELTEPSQDTVSTVTALLGAPVTDLIIWLEGRPGFEADAYQPDWESAKREAADYLLDVLERFLKMPPDAIKSVLTSNEQGVLNALSSLQNANSPTEANDEDPTSVAINSTKGRALFAAIAFEVAWVRSSAETETGEDNLHPDIRHLFEQTLDRERHPAVRCVFGWRFPYLFHVAQSWALERIDAIFPTHEDDMDIWRASWDAYVQFNQLYGQVWRILRGQYAIAVSRLGRRAFARVGPGDADSQLGAHVFLAWFSGYEAAEAILANFLAQSTDEQRARLSWYGARVLHANVAEKGLGTNSEEWKLLERFLRDRIQQRSLLGQPELGPREAAGFIDWLEDIPTPLPIMMDVIETLADTLTEEAEYNWQAGKLVDFVCSQSGQFPLDAVKVLNMLSQHAWPKWLSGDQTQRVEETMRKACQQPGGLDLVRILIGELSRRHHFEYRGVLEEFRDGS